MAVTVVNPKGDIVRRSQNLRGLLVHARIHAPESVSLHHIGDGYYRLIVNFWNGDVGVSRWADWRVCADWLRSRRSWGHLAIAPGSLPEWVERYDR